MVNVSRITKSFLLTSLRNPKNILSCLDLYHIPNISHIYPRIFRIYSGSSWGYLVLFGLCILCILNKFLMSFVWPPSLSLSLYLSISLIYIYIYRVYQTIRASQISRKPWTTDKNISDKSCRVSSNVLYNNIGTTLNSVVKVT